MDSARSAATRPERPCSCRPPDIWQFRPALHRVGSHEPPHFWAAGGLLSQVVCGKHCANNGNVPGRDIGGSATGGPAGPRVQRLSRDRLSTKTEVLLADEA